MNTYTFVNFFITNYSYIYTCLKIGVKYNRLRTEILLLLKKKEKKVNNIYFLNNNEEKHIKQPPPRDFLFFRVIRDFFLNRLKKSIAQKLVSIVKLFLRFFLVAVKLCYFHLR